MDPGTTRRMSRFSSYERLVAIGLALLAVVSPLYIDRREASESEVDNELGVSFESWLLVLLLMLILAIVMSLYLDISLTRFDAYWIHRVGGSSGGIIILLVVLAMILKCRAS